MVTATATSYGYRAIGYGYPRSRTVVSVGYPGYGYGGYGYPGYGYGGYPAYGLRLWLWLSGLWLRRLPGYGYGTGYNGYSGYGYERLRLQRRL